MRTNPNNIADPIHEMDENELKNIIDAIWERIGFLWDHPSMKPKKTQVEIEQQVNHLLNILIEAIKKSIVSLYPQWGESVSEVIDTDEACYFQSLLDETKSLGTPLYGGVTALLKTYSLLESYKTNYGHEGRGAILPDFQHMVWAIKEYVASATDIIFVKGFAFTTDRERGFIKKVTDHKDIRIAFADHLIKKHHRHLNASELTLKILDEPRAIPFDYRGIAYQVFRIKEKDRSGNSNYSIHFQSSVGPFKCAMDTFKDTIRERQKKVQ